MKKIIAFIMAAVMLITGFVPAYAEEETVPPEGFVSEVTEPEDEVQDPSEDEDETPDSSEPEAEKPEYYYITQEEFEKYRKEYFDAITTPKLFAAIGFQGLECLAYMLLPLAVPVLIFVPFAGAIAAGAALMAPLQGILSFGEILSGSLYIMFHRNEMYENFSTDWLYAQPETEYDENGEYSIKYKVCYKDPEDDVSLWSDCLPVAIKDN
jgi:hypothetical protein